MAKNSKQKIDCEVHDCKYCDCECNQCVKEEIKVCSCAPEKEKVATMCDSYKKKEDD